VSVPEAIGHYLCFRAIIRPVPVGLEKQEIAITGEELMAVVGLLRRTVRRRVRRDWPHRPLPESEVELLRLVLARPGTRVQEAAAAIGVAPNTVSTLVRRLTEQGLIARGADPDDARAARLVLTPVAKRRIAAWRDRRKQIVGHELDALNTDDRRAIADALPALRRLVDRLEERS
jgi:DNA-binding MarR family transcriptional regulator